jgi:hypothetical protein
LLELLLFLALLTSLFVLFQTLLLDAGPVGEGLDLFNHKATLD